MLQASASASTTIITTLLSGVVSGVAVAIFNYFLTRRKTKAEIQKLQIEADKISLEAEKLRKELSTNAESIASATYQLSSALERTVYDSRTRDIGFDFKGTEGYFWEKDVRVSPRGTGTLGCERNILNLRRTNTDGRYELSLHSYSFGESERDVIPKDDLVAGRRRFKVSFEAKVVGGSHTLKFIFKGLETKRWLAHGEREVTDENWTLFTIHLLVSATENCLLRIDDQDVSTAPSSIQIRNLVITESVSRP